MPAPAAQRASTLQLQAAEGALPVQLWWVAQATPVEGKTPHPPATSSAQVPTEVLVLQAVAPPVHAVLGQVHAEAPTGQVCSEEGQATNDCTLRHPAPTLTQVPRDGVPAGSQAGPVAVEQPGSETQLPPSGSTMTTPASTMPASLLLPPASLATPLSAPCPASLPTVVPESAAGVPESVAGVPESLCALPASVRPPSFTGGALLQSQAGRQTTRTPTSASVRAFRIRWAPP